MWDLDIRERSCICPFFDRTSHRCSTGTCAGSFLHIGLVDTLAGTLAHLVQSDTCMYHRVDRKDSRHSRTSDGSEVRRWSSCTMTHNGRLQILVDTGTARLPVHKRRRFGKSMTDYSTIRRIQEGIRIGTEFRSVPVDSHNSLALDRIEHFHDIHSPKCSSVRISQMDSSAHT